MSDDDDSRGIIGSLFSIFILIAIWPYLLALLGIYIVYLMAIAILEWIAANWILVMACAIGFLVMYLTYRLKLIPKGFNRIKNSWNPRSMESLIEGSELMTLAEEGESPRKFVPSSNLYCYCCTRKLGLQTFEGKGKYFCKDCYEKLK